MTPVAATLPRAVARPTAKPWQILCGLIVSGFLLALPGGLLPLWGYHIHPDFGIAGDYFLVLGAGVIGGGMLALRLARTIPLERLLAAGYFFAAVSVLLLSVAAPPAQVWYQMAGAARHGRQRGNHEYRGAGGHDAELRVQSGHRHPDWRNFFWRGQRACGVPARAILRGRRSHARCWPSRRCCRRPRACRWPACTSARREVTEISLAQSMHDLRSPLAIFFALLLFFQFANEWSLAGWLPVFLIDRMGLSPCDRRHAAGGLLAGADGGAHCGCRDFSA